MNNNLYQGWTPKPQSTVEIIANKIEYFIASEKKLLVLIDECENNGHYGECPEDRDIHANNLKFIATTITNLIDTYGDLTTDDNHRPTRLRMERAARVVVCDARRVEVKA